MRALTLRLVLVACDAAPDPPADVVGRGNRTLAIGVTQAETEAFGDAIASAKALGATALSLSQGWDDIETAPRTFAPAIDFFDIDFFDIGNTVYPQLGLQVALALIDTNVDRRPGDLHELAWNDPAVIARYRAALDGVAMRTPDLDVTHVLLGNEVETSYGLSDPAFLAYLGTLGLRTADGRDKAAYAVSEAEAEARGW